MTFNVGTVQGGTRAGWRTVRQTAKDWVCLTCDTFNRYYRVECDCGKSRD